MAWHRRCGCWLSPVSARSGGVGTCPVEGCLEGAGSAAVLQALETHVGTAVGLATVAGKEARLPWSGHRWAVTQSPGPQCGCTCDMELEEERRASSPGEAVGAGLGTEGSSSWWAIGGESIPLGPGAGSGRVGGPCCILGWAVADGREMGVAAPCPDAPEVSHLLWAGAALTSWVLRSVETMWGPASGCNGPCPASPRGNAAVGGPGWAEGERRRDSVSSRCAGDHCPGSVGRLYGKEGSAGRGSECK